MSLPTARAAPTLAELFRAHAAQVHRWAARLGGPSIDADDVVQEVFLAAHRKLGGFRGDAQLTTWLYGITENVVRHRRRKERWRRFLGGGAADVAGDVPDPSRAPDEQLAGAQAAAETYRALDALKEKYRTVLILFELEGHSGEEIAALMGAKVATVWVWLHRARAEFAKQVRR